MARKGRRLIVGLDIGTSSVKAVVNDTGNPAGIVGVGECPSLGIRKGIVMDIDAAAQSVRQAVESALEMAGVKATGVYMSFSGAGVEIMTNRYGISLGRGRSITEEDINRLQKNVRLVELPQGKEIINTFPADFSVNGKWGVKRPAGKIGSHMEIEARLLITDTYLVNQLINCVKKAGFDIIQIFAGPLAIFELLKPAETELGVAVVDAGGGTTGISVFNRGGLSGMHVLPVGGEHITSDLAIGLRTTLSEAEQVKRQIGVPDKEALSSSKYLELNRVGGADGTHRVPMRAAAEIIDSRIQEILDLVGQKIKELSGDNLLVGGVVLTGGQAGLKGLARVISERLEMPVRVETPDIPGIPGDFTPAPAWSVSLGLIKNASHQNTDVRSITKTAIGIRANLRSRFFNLF